MEEGDIREILRGQVCERCGAKIDYVERKVTEFNTYLYAIHVTKEGGKWRTRKCYLGPEEEYKNVTKLHADKEGLILRGLMDQERDIEYFERLAEHFMSMELDDRRREKLQRIVMRLSEFLGLKGVASEAGGKVIKISREKLSDILLYYKEKKTRRMSQKRIDDVKKIFHEVFSAGRKIVEVEG
jgi:hypothetical protein